MCVTNHYEMTLAVKVALNLNTTKQYTLMKSLERQKKVDTEYSEKQFNERRKEFKLKTYPYLSLVMNQITLGHHFSWRS